MGILTTPFLLAQIDLGLFSDWLNSIFAQYGAITALIAVFLVVGMLILRGQTNAQVAQTTLINEIARKNTDELSKRTSEFISYQMDTERKQGILEGRVIQLDRQVEATQTRYEKEVAALKEQVTALSKQIEELQHERNTAKADLAAITQERDNLKFALNDEQAKNSKLGTQIEELQRDRDLAQKRIDELEKKFADIDKTIPLSEADLAELADSERPLDNPPTNEELKKAG